MCIIEQQKKIMEIQFLKLDIKQETNKENL